MITFWLSYCIIFFLYFYSIMMTDQLEQEITHFKKKIDNLNIEIQLLTEEDAIWVKVMNLDSLECFEQVIDPSYIQNHKDLNYIFEAPRELMRYFIHHYKELNISSDGIIKFTIKFSETVKPKIVVINLKAKTMDKVEMLNLKMEKVKQDFAQTLAEKDRTIEQLNNRMNDQLEQEITHFKKKINNMNIEIQSLKEENAICIKVMNLENLECFEEIIDPAYIQSHKDINFIFETPGELTRYFAHHYKDINISSDGTIKLSIKFSDTMRPKLVVINQKEKKMDKVELLNVKMEKMKENFEEKLAEKDTVIEQLRNQIQKLNESCSQANKTLNNCLYYTHSHPQNNNNSCFLTKYTGISLIVKQLEPNAQRHFVFYHEITVGSVKRYALKIIKAGNINGVAFGFGSRLILNNANYNATQLASYRCDGNLFEGGANRNCGVGSNIGDELEWELNLIDFRVN